ncbi:hypothetical protein [Nocardioides dongxiaopingii]|uniref:hypothetical protein n=1 Tax=Nocardioides dongxiaopingii TaxID=2576036 RepID=UPI001484D407|nr:hypothetical protein [Nocardioides dongxiaopingii]
MPNPAFAKLKQAATIVFHAGDKAVRTATPVVRRAAEDVRDRLHRPGAPAPAAPGKSAATEEKAPAAGTGTGTAPRAKAGSTSESSSEPSSAVPSPAAIAKNVPHQRPVAKPAPTPEKKASDVPGGKLPPRR